MEISYFGPSCPLTHVHVHVIINNLKQFSGLGNTARLYLGPDRHVVQLDLECSRANKIFKYYSNELEEVVHVPDELGLDSITEEECHHARVDLVLQHPGRPGGSVHVKEGERVE